ncbi:MAG: FAD-dependent oxidoreductase [Burkholderiales bacterium]|nr:FAD-dependent oxidoreductase [Burkholderiales bacterium]
MDEHSFSAKSKPWLPQAWDREADVVIVGYGGAGVCAAIVAHDAGAEVLVLEKAPWGGGNTGCSRGGMNIPSELPGAIEYYRALTQGTVDDDCIRALAEAVFELPRRLEEWGAELESFPQEPEFPALPGARYFHQWVSIARTPEQKAEQEKTGRAYAAHGDQLFAFLESQARKRGIRVLLDTPAKQLIQDPITKEILGVRAERADGTRICVRARRGVVLACGGFQANREMLVNYLPYFAQLPVYPFGTPYNTGDGIVMAAEAGAKLWHMSGCELGTFAPKAPSAELGVGVRLERQLPRGSQAIYVNKYGRRFMNEAVLLSHRKDLFKVQQFDHDRAEYPNIPLYMVFDETQRKKRPIVGVHMGWWFVHRLHEWSADNSAEVERGWILKADSVRALAAKIGVDADALEATVERYNAHCASGEDSDFGRLKDWLAPLCTPPFYATELCQPIINTQGGPKRNARAQVLDNAEQPIARLYAAGELGSFFFPLYESASNIPEALAFGRIAGAQAAALSPW